MCLITNRQKPLVADRDLIVCKILVLKEDGWITPVRDVPITTNLLVSSVPNDPKDDKICGRHQINGEGVHAYTNLANRVGFKAIIPKGSLFWVSSDLMEIASTKLILTEEEYSGDTDLEYICDLLLKDVKVEYSNNVVSINNYHIDTRYIGKGANYHVLNKFGIKLFSADELEEIFKYRIYINACLYKNKQNLIPSYWHWARDIISPNMAPYVHPYVNKVGRDDKSSVNTVLAKY